jgi:hypothetical protein
MISAKLLTYNTSFVNSWYGIVPFPTSEYALIRKRRNALFKTMFDGGKIDNTLLDLLVKQPTTEAEINTCAPYYILLYEKCLEVVASFLNESSKTKTTFIAVSLQEQNYTKHAFDVLTKLVSNKIVSNYIAVDPKNGPFATLTSIFKIPDNYILINHNNKNYDKYVYPDEKTKSTPAEENTPIYVINTISETRNEMLIFDVGSSDFPYKKANGFSDNGRPCGIVRFDNISTDTTILHFNCHLPNPSILTIGGSTTILDEYENGNGNGNGNKAMTEWANAVIVEINKITEKLDNYYDAKIKDEIIVFFSGDMNDPYGILMKMLGESKLMINNTPILITFATVNATCCANSNSTTAVFNHGYNPKTLTTSTNIKNFPNNNDTDWNTYQPEWDNADNYKFQGDNIGVGYLTASTNTYRPYDINSEKYNPSVDTTYSDHSPVVSTILFNTRVGGYKRRQRKTKRANKRTHKKRTNRRKGRK